MQSENLRSARGRVRLRIPRRCAMASRRGASRAGPGQGPDRLAGQPRVVLRVHWRRKVHRLSPLQTDHPLSYPHSGHRRRPRQQQSLHPAQYYFFSTFCRKLNPTCGLSLFVPVRMLLFSPSTGLKAGEQAMERS